MTAVQEEFPLSQCAFSAERMAAQVGNNTLESGRLRGVANGEVIEWIGI